MTRTIIIGILTLLLTSCTEKFDYVDPFKFNNSIENRTDIQSAEQLIKIYYDYPDNEGTPNLTTEKKELENYKIEITLIHDRQEDDSQRATKIVMTAQYDDKKWTVLEIKTNRKCWDGRGHTNWGTEWCN